MACIAAILMLNIKYNKSKIFHISVGILISVIIYYINYFFNVIIETQDVPYLISIWGPQLIFAMIVLTNLVNINEKNNFLKFYFIFVNFFIIIFLISNTTISSEIKFKS